MVKCEYRSGRKTLLATIAKFASGNLVAMALTLVSGLLAARAVGPEVLGLFGSIALVGGYAPWLLVGTANGIGRELPYWTGKGDRERAEDLAAVASAWALLIASGCAAGMLIVAGWQAALGHWQMATGWLTQSFMVWVLLYGVNYLQFTYRRPSDFVRLSKIKIFQSVANLSSVGLVFVFGFYGLCMRGFFTAVTQVTLYWRWRPVRVCPQWSKRDFLRLVKVGFPIMFVGQLYTWWSVLNNTLLLIFLGVAGLGLNSLVIMSNSVGLLFPRAVGQVVYPQMTAEYARTGCLRNSLRIAALPALILFPLMCGIVAVGWNLAPLVVSTLLPKYTEAVPAVQWNLLTWLPMSLGSFNNIYTTTGRMTLYTISMVGGVIVYLACLYLMLKGEGGLVVFAQSMLVGRSAFQLFSLAGIAVLLVGNNRSEEANEK